MRNYILKDGVPVVEPNIIKWARWFEGSDEERSIARSDVPGGFVSTVFLGVDHSFGEGPAILYETMVFDGSNQEEQARYSTKAEALLGHDRMVEQALKGDDDG